MKLPLNGTKTHPLSAHAISILRRLARDRIPAYQINPGVINRLMREDLIELRDLPSYSYKMAKITNAGLMALSKIDGGGL